MANEFEIHNGLLVNGSGSTIVDIQGSNGQLFSVVDSLSGSLMSVNNISGIPVFEVFSDNTVKIGTFADEAIVVKGNYAQIEQAMTVAVSDETTAITTGTNKIIFRSPYAITLTKIPRASLSVSGSTLTTVDINESGTSILSTKLTIDANELTSTTAATAAVLSDTTIADDAEISVDIDGAGTGAKGLKVTLYYKRT
jgi:hypothetical protein